jgi:hypothetical protein
MLPLGEEELHQQPPGPARIGFPASHGAIILDVINS